MITRKDILSNARLFVAEWAKNRVLTGNDGPSLRLDHTEQVSVYNYSLKMKLLETGEGQVDTKKIKGLKPIPRNELDDALEEHMQNLPKRQRDEVATAIKTTGENLEPLKQWVKAVTGKLEDDDLYVMAHWLWLVKRNAMHYNVIHHIMPIITSSKQGGGKSTAVKMLLSPVETLLLELKVPQVVDERSFTMFTNYLVGFFDEMAGAEKVEISDFKRNVTSSTLTYRPMRTNTQVKISNLCSFIGASNNSVYEIIKDTTGIRRFFPIQALELLDHQAINSINYQALWRGVDETLERGYYERVKDRVAQKQEELAMRDEVQLFLENFSIIPNSDTELTSINGKILYQEYVMHTKNEGIRFQVAAQTFYKKLRDMGLFGVKKRDEKKVWTWFFEVNKNNALGGLKYDS